MKGKFSLLLTLFVIMNCSLTVFASEKASDDLISSYEAALIQQDKIEQAETILTDESMTAIMKNNDFKIKDNAVEFTYVESLYEKDNVSTRKSLATDIYKSVNIVMIPKENKLDDLINTINSVKSGQANYRSDTDESGSVTGYITVYYESETIGGNDFVRMTSISGGYERHDRSVGITSQSVAVTQKGRTYEHGNLNEYMNKSVSGTTWSFSIPSDWYSVMTDAVTGWVGANYTFSMHRGSSDWSHTVYCPVVTNVITPPID